MRELAPSKGFGFVDAKPLWSPEPAERVARYLSKYLAKWKPDGSMEVTEPVEAAGRTLLNFVSRKLTAKSGVTMRALRNVRIAWVWKEGHLPDDVLDPWDPRYRDLHAGAVPSAVPSPLTGRDGGVPASGRVAGVVGQDSDRRPRLRACASPSQGGLYLISSSRLHGLQDL